VDGQLLFVHGDILMARPFSLEALEFTGPAVPLINEIMRIQGAHLGVYSASASGTLVYASSGRIFNQAALQWLDLDGERQDLDVDAQLTLGFDVSPDGRHVAMSVIDANIGTADLWLYEVDRNLRTRFTFATEVEAAPIWSPDGLWIAYANDGDRRSQVYRQLVSGLGAPERITHYAGDVTPSSWSEDGRYIACSAVDSTGDVGILLLDLVDGTSTQFRDTEFTEGQPVFSPNGRWLAYTSDETGTPQIFVESVSTGGGRWRVSTDEGHSPLWSPTGDRIHYLTLNGRVLSTVVNETGDALRFGETRQIDEGVAADFYRNFSVNRSTGQLLVARPAPQDENNLMKLVTRWQRLLER
jgi:Tol biopolymer transport system component